MSDETFTEAELTEALKRWGYLTAPWYARRLVADIVHHREHFEPGEIYQDARGRRLMRRDGELWPWRVLSYVQGDQICHDGRDFGTYHPEEYAQRPLRKLVPEE